MFCSIFLLFFSLFIYEHSSKLTSTEFDSLGNLIGTQKVPKHVLENLCLDKNQQKFLQKTLMKQNIRYQTFRKNSTILEQYYQPQYYTVLANLDCKFKEFLDKALKINLATFPNVWIVLGDISKAKNENHYIPVNSLFIFPKISNNKTKLNTMYKINKNFTEYNEQVIGNWLWNEKNVQILANFNIIRTRSNFRGALLRVSYVVTHNSTMEHLTDYREKHLDNFTKINYVLYCCIADILNATHVRLIENSWGFEKKNDKGVITFSPGMFFELVHDYADVSGNITLDEFWCSSKPHLHYDNDKLTQLTKTANQ